MASTKDAFLNVENRGVNAIPATAAVTYYSGDIVAIASGTGKVVKWADTAGFSLAGIVESHHPLTAYGVLAQVDEVSVNESGPRLRQVSVAGVTAQTDMNKFVYATDENTLTLTPTANVGAIGRITRWYGTTICDVETMTPMEYLLQ